MSEGTGRLVLFLHGFPEHSESWLYFLKRLGRSKLAVAPDLRGIGKSQGSEAVDDYHITRLCDDVRDLIQSFGHERCVLVGHDWGGLIAWYVAYLYPELLSKIILINAVHPVCFSELRKTSAAQRDASSYIEKLVSPVGESFCTKNNFEVFTQTLFAVPTTLSEIEKKSYLDFWNDGHSLKAGINFYKAYVAPNKPLPDVQHAINIPVRIIWGQGDHALIEKNLDGIPSFAADLKIAKIANGGHWVHHRYPEKVLAILEEFLADY